MFRELWQSIKGKFAFDSLHQSERQIVFYAEDIHSFMHFQEIIETLYKRYGQSVCYLTSDLTDPILETPMDGVKAFYIGEGVVRTTLFRTLKADLCIMTMPDLNSFHLKRSQVYDVHYLYLFHAMVSTHSNYRKGAFDHYDTIFCTGEHQINEIRATEKYYDLPQKNLYRDGYRRLEALIEDVKIYRAKNETAFTSEHFDTVIVAPSWGENAILEVCGIELVTVLLEANYNVIVRPHPMTVKHSKQVVDKLKNEFQHHPMFSLQLDVRDKKTLYESDFMISDWSGVAMEYAFSCEKPVVFIDVPKKCNNLEADLIEIEPIETSIRNKIGYVVPPHELEKLPAVLIELKSKDYTPSVREVRGNSVFNIEGSLDKAVDEIYRIAKDLSSAVNSRL